MRRAAMVCGGLGLILGCLWLCPAPAAAWQAREIGLVAGLGHPESVAWDAMGGRAFAGRFGPERKPNQKDGLGFISRLDGDGKVVEERFLPRGGALHKPKGLWVADGRLWAPDIDTVWVFDLNSGQGRALAIAGAVFLNDAVVAGGKLYVSDTVANRIYLVEPADFLTAEPRTSLLLEQSGLAPNGLWAEAGGSLLIASSPRDGSHGTLHRLAPGAAEARAVTRPLGRLDGLAVLRDGVIVYTDWATGSIYALKPGGEPQKLAEGFGGPADFALIPSGAGYRMLAPDLVKGEIRVFELTP